MLSPLCRLRNLFGAVLLSGSAATAATYCTSGPTPFWCDNDCNAPQIVVSTSGQATVVITGQEGNWTIAVTVHSGQPDVTIRKGGTTPETINSITITVPEGIDSDLTLLPGDIANVKQIAAAGAGRLFVQGRVLGNLGPPNSGPVLTASAISTRTTEFTGLRIDGNTLGDIALNDPTDGIDVQIADFEIVGNLVGSIECHDGGLNFLRVGGRIGGAALNEHVNIFTREDINYIRARRIHAHIEAGAYSGPDSNIYSVASWFGDSTNNGDFTGSITAHGLGTSINTDFGGTTDEDTFNRIEIQGDLGREDRPAIITLETPLTNYSGGPSSPSNDGADRRIVVGGSFRDGSEIHLPEDGLVGQALFNTRLLTGAVWEVGALIQTAGQIPIDRPNYNLAPSENGGGSAGTAPYALHGNACTPADASVIALHIGPSCTLEGDPTCFELGTCVVSIPSFHLGFYGPLVMQGDDTDYTDADNTLIIKKRTIASNPPDWSTLPDISSQFEMLFPQDGDLRRSTITLRRKDTERLEWEQEYQVRPRLQSSQGYPSPTPPRCADALGEPVVQDFEYTFVLYFDCRGGFEDMFDLNEDGVVNYTDLLLWLQEQQDLNYDGNLDAIDFALLWQAIDYYNSLP